MGGLGFGFLRGWATPQLATLTMICGVSKKRKNEEPSAGISHKKPRNPVSGRHLVIRMVLHQDKERHQIRVLLDTSYSIALINQPTVEKLGIQKHNHKNTCSIKSYTGESVGGVGQFYTAPMLLQHRRHYSREKFEISPMDVDIDAFLPFEWISAHPPQGVWTDKEIRFNSIGCLTNCTQYEMNKFSLTWDDSVTTNPTLRLIGYVSTVSEEDPLEAVPREFRQHRGIMGKEVAEALPKHRRYNCKIDLQEGSTAPWGPIYLLTEVEL